MNILGLMLATGEAKGATLGDDLIEIVSLIVMIFGGLVLLYALYLMYLMATASDSNKRAEAKKRVINTFAICLIIIALIGILRVVGVAGGNTVSTTGWKITIEADSTESIKFLRLDLAPESGFEVANPEEVRKLVSWRVVSGNGWEIKPIGEDKWHCMLSKASAANAAAADPSKPKPSDVVTVQCLAGDGMELARREISAK